MRSFLLLVSAALLSGLEPARAQSGSPWAAVTTFHYGSYWSYVDCIQLPTPTSAWSVHHNPRGMGVNSIYINTSTDNGASWESQINAVGEPRYPYSAGYGTDFTDFWAVGAQEAWAVAKQMNTGALELHHTTTGPTGFAATTAQVPSPVAVRFFTPTTGIVLSSSAGVSIYRTTNGGQSWQPVAAAPALIYDFRFLYYWVKNTKCQVLGQHVWILDATGKLAHSADAGLTWITTTLAAPLESLAFRDELHGLAYGPLPLPLTQAPARSLYRTADGGLTWTLVSPTGPLRVLALLALPSRPSTYLSANNNNAPLGTSISYDEGQSWAALDSTSTGTLAADATGRVWSSTFITSPSGITLRRLATSALGATKAQPMGIELYPNPTAGVVHLPALPEYQQVTVYDLTGRQCRTSPLNRAGTALDLSGLSAGSYLLRLEGGAAVPRQQRVTVAP
ncbi:MAG: T9SS type A sorting domain-containing protein [Hymenobacter sp.]|nr:MAG: T9SS type A sorting domain-containing protein [Hymenobacter sp.]